MARLRCLVGLHTNNFHCYDVYGSLGKYFGKVFYERCLSCGKINITRGDLVGLGHIPLGLMARSWQKDLVKEITRLHANKEGEG